MYLAVTIDTEEDNWSNYDSEPVLSNIGKIPDLQKLFDRYGVTPNYLISYPVATDRNAVSILRGIMEDGRCEIGAHPHAWNTPPFEEEKTARSTMLSNLDKGLQRRKLETLHSKIVENFRIEPVTFRSGRWGFDRTVAGNIHRLGYKVDTSVSPYSSWVKYEGPDFSDRSPMPQKIHFGEGGKGDGWILEVPATIGFLQGNYDLCNRALKTISGTALRHFRLMGIFDRMKLLNKVCLSPEPDTAENMIGLAKSMERNGYQVLNLFFHSTSLQHGLNHFTKTREDAAELMNRIEKFLEYAMRSNMRPVKLSEAPNLDLKTGIY
ncbi:MAG: hypothetical protein H6Q84_1577 [Deltaproteobacteria bacterium]|nr:hypothetical protein [Deltaproteobacteria bacterium]